MKKILLSFVVLLITLCSFAQTAVNEDGTIKFRGNVAIFVNSRYYTFNDGKAVKSVDEGITSALETALRAMVMEKFQNMAFGIVNRDDEASRQVEELIEENKLEDYLDGISVRAKNQGADYLYLVDIIVYGENNNAAQIDISTRLLNVENNFGYHSFFRSDAIPLSSEGKMRDEVSKMIKTFSLSLENSLLHNFPEQYYITKIDGKDWYLGAYQPNGMILPTDKFYAFSLKKENVQLGANAMPLQVLENVAICKEPALSNGHLVVKSNTGISNTSDVVLFRNTPQPLFQGTNQMTLTFFGLNTDNDSYDGLTKDRINNAVFAAITRHPGLQLIEHDHLASLKEERELQKSEDFLDGHVVEQMKAIGARFLIKLEDYFRDGGQVSFKLSLISIEQNMIGRTVDVVTSIDNIEKEVYKQICDRFGFPCVVKKVGKNKYELSSIISLQTGNDCILQLTKPSQNPLTGETSYNRVDVCTLLFEEYMGNKCIVSVDKILSKDDMKNIEDNSNAGMVTFRIDGSKIKTELEMQTEVQRQAEKQEKREKTKGVLRAIGGALFGN
jgi:hypothetical protein